MVGYDETEPASLVTTRKSRKASKTTKRSIKQPSSSMYVGYVEDEESIESIMRKFQKMEEIKEQVQSLKISSNNNNISSISSSVGSDSTNIFESQNEKQSNPTIDVDSNKNCTKNYKDEGLTQEQLEEVFKQTSMFSAKQLNKESKLGYEIYQAGMSCDEDDMEWKYDLYLRDKTDEEDDDEFVSWSDDEELWEDSRLNKKRTNAKRDRLPREKREKQPKQSKQRLQGILLQPGGERTALKRKTKFIDPRKPSYSKPVRNKKHYAIVKTYQEYIKYNNIYANKTISNLPPCTVYSELDLHRGDSGTLIANVLKQGIRNNQNSAIHENEISYPENEQPAYQCIYMDPPLVSESYYNSHNNNNNNNVNDSMSNNKMCTLKHIGRLDLGKHVKAGFIFIWLEKEFVPEIFSLMRDWDFKYVENLCWMFKDVNNKLAKLKHEYLQKRKLTCYIFRKVTGPNDVELRHQRNCDVVVDYLQPEDHADIEASLRKDILSRKLNELTTETMHSKTKSKSTNNRCNNNNNDSIEALKRELAALEKTINTYRKCHRPEFLYEVIETLLPDARCECNPTTNTPRVHVGRIVELWAERHKHREGWISIPHVPYL